MATFVTPGVYTREIDASIYIPSLATTIVGMVGATERGPVNVPTYISNQAQFVKTFGTTHGTTYLASFAALQYLAQGRNLWFIRVIDESATTATASFGALYPLVFSATSAGSWGNDVRVVIAPTSTMLYDNAMSVSVYFDDVLVEKYVNAVFDSSDDNFLETLINGVSSYITVDVSPELETEYGSAVDDWFTDDLGGVTSATSDLTGGLNENTGSAVAATGTIGGVDTGSGVESIDLTAFTAGADGNAYSISIDASGTDPVFTILNDGAAVASPTTVTGGLITDFITAIAAVQDSGTQVMSGVATNITETDLATWLAAQGYDTSNPIAINLYGGVDAGTDVSGELVGPDENEYFGVTYDDALGTPTGLQLLRDPARLDVNLIAVPGVSSASIINEMLDICETRGDCMAVIDCPMGLSPQDVVDWTNGEGSYNDHTAFNSSYGAVYYPWVKVLDPEMGQYVWTPPSGHVLKSYAYNDYVGESWYAPAGMNRGLIHTGFDLEYYVTEGDNDLLYTNNINPIRAFPKDGMVIWGQKTLQRKPSALDRVNVRRLLLYIRKGVSTSIRYLVFEPNDKTTWNQFGLIVQPFMNNLMERRGLYDFRLVCDETTNTPDVIDRNEMKAQIFIKPVKAAEFIIVDVVITQTGASFDEVTY